MHPDNERGRLNEHFAESQTELPTHLDWDVLGPGIIGKKKHRRFFWWIWGGVAGAVVGFLVFMSWPSTSVNNRGADNASLVVVQTPTTNARSESSILRTDDPSSSVPASEVSAGAGVSTIVRSSDQVFSSNKVTLSAYSPLTALSVISEPSSEVGKADNKTEDLSTKPAVLSAVSPLVPRSISPVVGETALLMSPVVHILSPSAPPLKFFREPNFEVSTGINRALSASDNKTALPGPALRLGVVLPLNEQKVKLSVQLTYDRQDLRSETYFTRNVNLYRPGTPDTLFRNVLTGDERLVTTDSVPGIREFWSRQHQQIHLAGAEVSLLRRFTANRWSMELGVGLGGAFVLKRKGFLLTEDGLTAPDNVSNLRWSGHGSAALGYKVSERLELILRAQYVLPVREAWNSTVRAVTGVRYRIERR